MLFCELFKQLTKCQSLLVRFAFLLVLVLLVSSCGKKVNSSQEHKLAEGVINQLSIEKTCQEVPLRYEQETLEVFNYYNQMILAEPTLLGYVSPRNYDFISPLIVKPEFFLQKLTEIKNNNRQQLSSVERQTLIIDELFYLEQSARRFEFSKCRFPLMTKKYVEDPRPFLKLGQSCKGDNGQNEKFCQLEQLKLMSNDELSELVKKAVPLCVSLTKNIVSCRSELYVKKQQGKVADFIYYYQERYKQEKFNKFYLLSDEHRRYSCEKMDDKIELTIQIYAPSLDPFQYQFVRDSIVAHWVGEKFRLKIQRISEDHQEALKIYLTDKLLSHVTNKFPNSIFLALSQLNQQNAKVIAHEFGHILGFPDCYSEIFDQKKNELVYFEHQKNEYNLMCTVKNFARVPSTYIQQLIERSCVFK